jgi:hypothetical protein
MSVIYVRPKTSFCPSNPRAFQAAELCAAETKARRRSFFKVIDSPPIAALAPHGKLESLAEAVHADYEFLAFFGRECLFKGLA